MRLVCREVIDKCMYVVLILLIAIFDLAADVKASDKPVCSILQTIGR